MRLIQIIIFVALVHLSHSVFADQEAGNVPFVKSSEYGRVYAKSIPDNDYGTKGKTLVYTVDKEGDKLLYTFDWFADQIYLLENVGSVIRLGPWARGHEPNDQDLAIGFYLQGKKLKEYSTLDIVKMGYDEKMNVRMSVSHYTVFEEIIGYRWIRNDVWAFDVKTHEGTILSFDVSTGTWYVNNKDATKKDTYDYKLSVEELKEWAGENYPQIPEGYQLHLGAFFEEVRLEKVE
jgi:hypothetical protein